MLLQSLYGPRTLIRSIGLSARQVQDTSEIPPHRRTPGVFITHGARVTIPAGGFRIGLAGEPTLTIHLALNMCPIWCELAFEHLREARRYHEAARAAWLGTDDDVLGTALISECKHGMQAVHSAATAVDALYAALKNELADALLLPPAGGGGRRPARYRHVAEVIRRSFQVQPRKAVRIRSALRELYRFRDWAAHPPQEAQQPIRHPDLLFDTEWRFVAFGYTSARALVRLGLSVSAQAGASRTPATPRLAEFCRGLNGLLAPTIAGWAAAYPGDPPLVPIPGAGTA